MENPNTSKDILPKDSMILILTDMHLADADAQVRNLMLDSSRALLKSNYRIIFAHYRINQQRFKKSLNYYTQRPKELDEMYAQVVNNLSKLNN